MSDEQKLLSIVPNGISGLRIQVETHDKRLFDISGNILEMSLYESIYYSYMHGELYLMDNSAMLSDFPFVGQEKLLVEWDRDDRTTTREFFITKVSNISRNRDGYGVYELTITSERQMRNATSLFSRSYRGRGDEIISGLFSDFLNTSIEREVEAKSTHSVVFPYMKPLQAVDMIRKNVLALDDTPMFVYDSLYDNVVRLDSLARMYSQDPITTIAPKKPSNTNPDGIATEEYTDERATVYSNSISRTYNTYDQINKGAYGSYVTIVDPSIRQYRRADFDFKRLAPTVSGEWITNDFTLGGTNVNELYDTKNYYLHRNKYAFNSEPPNLSSIDDLDLSILNSYVHRHATSLVKVYMDSIAYTRETDEAFGVGKTVEYRVPTFDPKLSQDDRRDDEVNSGKYIISAIRHYIKNNEYTMSVELIRDGVGEDAEFTEGVLAGAAGVRTRSRILPEY